MRLIDATDEKCCCNCIHDIRIKDGKGMAKKCICQQDGSTIGYVQSFEYMCKEWKAGEADGKEK